MDFATIFVRRHVLRLRCLDRLMQGVFCGRREGHRGKCRVTLEWSRTDADNNR